MAYRLLKAFTWLSVAGMFSVILFFFLVFFGYFGKIPSAEEIKNVQNNLASEVYSADGKVLGKYYKENRTKVSYSQISPHIINGLISTEDKRFFEHDGIDIWSAVRVLFKSVLLGNRSSGGGSTISQQLAKNIYGRKYYGFLTMPVNKTREMIIGSRFENLYTKREVLALYLNTVSFGEDTYGVNTASLLFFNKRVKDVTIEEAATLVGTLKAPSTYNPRVHPDKALNRRNTVLELMYKNKYIKTERELKKYKAIPIKLEYNNAVRNEGLAPYLRERIRKEIDKHLEFVHKPNGESYDIYTDGLKIYTTIDSRMQTYAEKAVRDHMEILQTEFDKMYAKKKPWKRTNKLLIAAKQSSERYKNMLTDGATEEEIEAAFNKKIEIKLWSFKGEIIKNISPWDSIEYYHGLLTAGLLAVDPRNGYVKAWVGGVDFKHQQYDHVLSRRQVGSTFKPIAYAAAMESGMSPCEYTANELATYTDYQNWTPENSDKKYGGYYSLKGALTKSLNTITARLTMNTGISNVIALSRRMGVNSSMPDMPAVSLGAADISLREMVAVYTTLANYGKRRDPIYLLRIEDKNGKLLKDIELKQPGRQVMSDSIAQLTVELLRGVVNNGTASRLRKNYNLTNDIAGKTGTTQSQRDGWFVGFTPVLVTGVWVGGDDPTVRFNSIKLGQGANTGLPIWGNFYKQIYADKTLLTYGPYATFRPLSDTLSWVMDCPDMVPTLDSVAMFERKLDSFIAETDAATEFTDETIEPITELPAEEEETPPTEETPPARKGLKGFLDRVFKRNNDEE